VKLLTHLYVANLLIKEIEEKEGKLEIAPIEGEYQIGTLKEPDSKGNKEKDDSKKDTSEKDTKKEDTKEKETSEKDTKKEDTKEKETSEKGTSEDSTTKKETSKDNAEKSTSEEGTLKSSTPEKNTSKSSTSEDSTPKEEAKDDSTSKKDTKEADAPKEAKDDSTPKEETKDDSTSKKDTKEADTPEKDAKKTDAAEDEKKMCGGKKCEDLNPVLIFPFKGGTFEVPKKVREAIVNNKEYFRAGAAGWDIFPDMLFSRLIIHPTDSGIWLEHMYEKLLTMPPGKEFDQSYAFLLGAMTHYATDMFGNSYVNEYAGGWSACLTGTNDIAQRHIAIESYIDSKLTDKIIPESERILRAPVDFLVYCFADAEGIKKKIGKIESRTYTPPGGFRKGEPIPDDAAKKRSEECLALYQEKYMLLYQMSRLREQVCGYVQYDTKSETPAIRALQEAGAKGELSQWLEDIDIVIKNWVIAWQLSLQGLIEGKSESHIADCMDRWIKNSCIDIVVGIPLWFSKVAATYPEELDLNWLSEVPLFKSPGPASGKDLLKAISPKDYEGFEKTYDPKNSKLDDKKIKALFKDRYKDAETFYGRLDSDLKKFGKDKEYPYGKEGEFKAFSLCLSASKLCLIGSENLNQFTGLKKKKFKGSAPKKIIRKIKVKIKAGSEESGEGGSGTYRQLRMDIVKNDSKVTRVVFGSKFNDDKGCVVALQKPINGEDIIRFEISKTGADIWEIDSLVIEDAETEKQLGSKNGVILGEMHADVIIERSPSVKEDKPGEIEVPHAIMSWMYSLDGADPTKINPAVNMPWEYEEYFVFYSVKSGSDEWAKYFDLKEMVEINYTPPRVKEKKRIFPLKDIPGAEEKTNKGKQSDGGKEMKSTMEKGNKVA